MTSYLDGSLDCTATKFDVSCFSVGYWAWTVLQVQRRSAMRAVWVTAK